YVVFDEIAEPFAVVEFGTAAPCGGAAEKTELHSAHFPLPGACTHTRRATARHPLPQCGRGDIRCPHSKAALPHGERERGPARRAGRVRAFRPAASSRASRRSPAP